MKEKIDILHERKVGVRFEEEKNRNKVHMCLPGSDYAVLSCYACFC